MPKKSTSVKTHAIQVRVSESDHALLTDAAQKLNLTVAEFVRQFSISAGKIVTNKLGE